MSNKNPAEVPVLYSVITTPQLLEQRRKLELEFPQFRKVRDAKLGAVTARISTKETDIVSTEQLQKLLQHNSHYSVLKRAFDHLLNIRDVQAASGGESYKHITLLITAMLFLFFKHFKKYEEFIHNHPHLQEFLHMVEYDYFEYTLPIELKCFSLPLISFFSKDFERANVTQFLEMVLLSCISTEAGTKLMDIRLYENLSTAYPAMFNHGLIEAVQAIKMANHSSGEKISQKRATTIAPEVPTAIAYELTTEINKLLQNISQAQAKLLQVVLSDSHQDFEQVKMRVAAFLNDESQRNERYFFLKLLGMNTLERAKNIFRIVSQLSQKSSESEFYTLLAQKLRQFITVVFKDQKIHTAHEFKDILITNSDVPHLSPIDVNSYQVMRTSLSCIHTKSKRTEWQLEPQQFIWVAIQAPQKLIFHVDRKIPLSCKITFEFALSETEVLPVAVDINMKTGQIDWSLLEAMDAVQVRFIMHTMMSVCVAAITQVSEIIAAEQQSVSTQNKILTNDEKIRDKRSKKRKAAVEQSTGMYVTEGAESADTAEVPGVQYRINVTDQRSIHEIFEKNRIPKDIRKRIWRFFHDINSDSRIFRYKQLDGVNYNGRPLIALDVDDYRIIVYEVGSVKGQRSFNVLMVGHRREVYEKANRVYK